MTLLLYASLALASVAMLIMPFVPVGSHEKVGRRYISTGSGWEEL